MPKPFLKWPGGKRWFRQIIAGLFTGTRYFEPFLGGGAVFFTLQPQKAILSDTNRDLISAFVAVRDEAEAVVRRLSQLQISKATFRRIRASSPVGDIDRAVRLIYLNRTAFNGIYRVNLDGKFNVPFGCKEGTKVCDAVGIRACSLALKHSAIHAVDFRVMLRKVRPSDALYVDPPYTVKHNNNGFRRYNERLFSWTDQMELALKLSKLARDGVQIVVSNSCHKEVRALYPRRHFTAIEVERSSCMAADVAYRGDCKELLLISRSVAETSNLKMVFESTGVRYRLLHQTAFNE
jgi:DNA adenine methylase